MFVVPEVEICMKSLNANYQIPECLYDSSVFKSCEDLQRYPV